MAQGEAGGAFCIEEGILAIGRYHLLSKVTETSKVIVTFGFLTEMTL